MTIHKREYRRYDGPLESNASRFWVIAEMEIVRLLKQKWVRRFLIMAWIPVVVLGVMLYGAIVVADTTDTGFDGLSGQVFVYLMQTETWFVAIMMAAFGADMIAKDVQHCTFSLYFTRPLTAMQYLIGKFLAVAAMVLSITLVPGIVLAAAQLLMDETLDLVRFLDMLWRLSTASILIAVVSTSVILMLSSLGKQPRAIGVMWIVIFFFFDITRSILISVIGNEPLLDLISIRRMMYSMTEYLFLGYSQHLSALITLVMVSCFCFGALRFRIQRLEKTSS